ncbi:hypothetical protein BLS_006495 [Venturia inaequalis]|uniref:Uncharacterized protein n=1 Tax=Venturia inaequalis TaxID=5025 RepID=A0A8H3Z1U7_VENIN|nr:hypothetical protein BLS_006495 [Venturia inaequalis]RDI79829.1 hypothetical protein Vi05172_g10141 [Venturia inaequalis]
MSPTNTYSPAETSPETEAEAETDQETDPETDPETHAPVSNAHARAVANRPRTRYIVRWDDEKLILVFFAFRKKLQEMGLDPRAALDAAVKEAIDQQCTGDAVVQQLVKRTARYEKEQAATKANGIANKKSSRTRKAAAPMTPPRSKAAKGKASSSSKAKSATAKPAKASFATPVATPRRNKAIAKAASGVTKGSGSVSISKSVKTEKKPAAPFSPSGLDDDSDSEYMESPDKSTNKRIRGSVSKSTLKSDKKSKREYSGWESESEYEMVDTPSKWPTSNSARATIAKKSRPATVSIEPGSARKSLSAPIETVKMFEQPESQDSGAEDHVTVKEPPSPERDLNEGFSRHDSKYNSPPSSNEYMDNFLVDFPSYGVFSGGQQLDSDSFGSPLNSGNQPSSYQYQVSGFSIGMSNGGLGQYFNSQTMPLSSNQDFYVPSSLQSFGSQIHGDLANDNANHNSHSLHGSCNYNFSATTSGDASGFPDFLAEPSQGSFFAAASENLGEHDGYDLLDTNYKFDGI